MGRSFCISHHFSQNSLFFSQAMWRNLITNILITLLWETQKDQKQLYVVYYMLYFRAVVHFLLLALEVIQSCGPFTPCLRSISDQWSILTPCLRSNSELWSIFTPCLRSNSDLWSNFTPCLRSNLDLWSIITPWLRSISVHFHSLP